MTNRTIFSRKKWRLLNATKKLDQVRSDTYFMPKCKQMVVIPKGLKIKKPLESTYNTAYSSNLCLNLSFKFRNHLVSIFYRKQEKLVCKINEIKSTIYKDSQFGETDLITKQIYDRKLANRFKVKLDKLNHLADVTISSNAKSPNYS